MTGFKVKVRITLRIDSEPLPVYDGDGQFDS